MLKDGSLRVWMCIAVWMPCSAHTLAVWCTTELTMLALGLLLACMFVASKNLTLNTRSPILYLDLLLQLLPGMLCFPGLLTRP